MIVERSPCLLEETAGARTGVPLTWSIKDAFCNRLNIVFQVQLPFQILPLA